MCLAMPIHLCLETTRKSPLGDMVGEVTAGDMVGEADSGALGDDEGAKLGSADGDAEGDADGCDVG